MSLELYEVIDEIADYLAAQGVPLGEAYKRRDPDEPGRALKERDEDRLLRLMKRRFATQKRQLRDALGLLLPPVKAIVGPTPKGWLDSLPPGTLHDEATERLIVIFFQQAALRAIGLSQVEASFDIDWSLVNARVLAWVRKYVFQFLEGLDATTLDALREALENFVTTPGFTIADVMAVLPFGEDRALRIAVTEITRIYAEAVRQAGQELKKQYPDVRIEKRWWTNRDDRVCPICQPLHGQITEIDDGFGVEPGEAGLLTPPAHTGCRCWLSTRTRI